MRDPWQQSYRKELWWNLRGFFSRLTPKMELSADWVSTLVQATMVARARQTRYLLEKRRRLRKYRHRQAWREYREAWVRVGWPPPKAQAKVVEDVDHVVQGTFTKTLRRHSLG